MSPEPASPILLLYFAAAITPATDDLPGLRNLFLFPECHWSEGVGVLRSGVKEEAASRRRGTPAEQSARVPDPARSQQATQRNATQRNAKA